MSVNNDEMLHKILDHISGMGYIKPEDIPNINLYMDQVTTFMEAQLAHSKRYEDDKILTKTMINNYAKNNLLPPPDKKKYSREHILILTFIYYFKNILAIKDIETLLNPLTETYFQTENQPSLSEIYEEICSMEKSQIPDLSKEISAAFARAEESFADAPEEDRHYLQMFSFICSLSFDVYVKKLLIEKLLDELPDFQKSQKKEK